VLRAEQDGALADGKLGHGVHKPDALVTPVLDPLVAVLVFGVQSAQRGEGVAGRRDELAGILHVEEAVRGRCGRCGL